MDVNNSVYDSMQRQVTEMSFGIDALKALSIMIPDAIDQDSTINTDQISALLRCTYNKLEECQQTLENILNEQSNSYDQIQMLLEDNKKPT